MPYQHTPVMLDEVLKYLNCSSGKTYVDCTLGGAGHAKAICQKIVPGGLLIGIDQDKAALDNAPEALKSYASNIRLFHDNFIHLAAILSELEIAAADGILLDLGLSLNQIAHSRRGFSFNKNEPLDMRMDVRTSLRAEEIVNTWDESELAKTLRTFGEERWARPIARKIVKTRKNRPIHSSKQLSEIVRAAIPKKKNDQHRIHPATRVFMALRIAVNHELEYLDLFMKNVIQLLKRNGRLCVLSFHSLEDRIVKHRMKQLKTDCICPPDFPKCVCDKKQLVSILTPKAIRPQKEELQFNPMARSAKLRVIEKIAAYEKNGRPPSRASDVE